MRRQVVCIIGEGNPDVMRKRFLYGSGIVLLLILATLVVWQGSFSEFEVYPENLEQTFIFTAVSTLVIVLMITLGFILCRTGIKLYIGRLRNREGSRGSSGDRYRRGGTRLAAGRRCDSGCRKQ